MERAIWASAKGYSRPGEVVDVIERRGGSVLIRSGPDNGPEREASPGGFSYWVPEAELSPVPGLPDAGTVAGRCEAGGPADDTARARRGMGPAGGGGA